MAAFSDSKAVLYTISMDSLHDLLKHRDNQQPPEISILQTYILENFKTAAVVIVHERDITIFVSSSSLANTLRLRGPILKRLVQSDKRFIFRIA
jgi:hypothetical protein